MPGIQLYHHPTILIRAISIYGIFEDAVRRGRKFRVIIVDSRPYFEGRDKGLPRLLALGIPTTYIHINAISYVLRNVCLYEYNL